MANFHLMKNIFIKLLTNLCPAAVEQGAGPSGCSSPAGIFLMKPT